MTVLLVDDQVSILSGLISGVNWDSLEITSIRTASSAVQAKKILEEEQIDILLCDIEMPGENGLSLLRWARKRNMNFICVFLTSHADFMYAKEAIQLNCFDYILQPARYDDIQAVVARAINRMKHDNAGKELAQYGILAKSHSPSLFQNIFSDWISGESLSVTALCNLLKKLGQDIYPENDCFVIWGHLLRWHCEPWPTQEWSYILNNIITEVYETNHCGILSFAIDHISMGWLIYSLSGSFEAQETTTECLNSAYSVISAHMPCELAFYLCRIVPLNQIDTQLKVLLRAKQDNVLQTSGIFYPQQLKVPSHFTRTADVAQIRRWGILLSQEEGLTVRDEVFRFFDDATMQNQANHEFIRNFWMQFQQIILNALWALGRKPDKILPILIQAQKAASLPEIREDVQLIAEYFQGQEKPLNKGEKTVEQIKSYLEDNLDQPLTIGDISAALFMNADYLSRLFKAECGITLKDYILKRKMEAAQNLLKTTALPVSVIAAKLGYDNFSYFSQAYRRIMGVSPTEERRS